MRLVARRGELMGAATVDGGMAAVIGLDREAVAEAIAAVAGPADLVVANDNAPGQVVISGTRAALLDAEEALEGGRRAPRDPAAGVGPVPLAVDGGRLRRAGRGLRRGGLVGRRSRRWSATSPPNRSRTPSASATCWPSRCARRSSGSRASAAWRTTASTPSSSAGRVRALTGMVKRIAPEARTLNVSDVATLEATVAALRRRAGGGIGLMFSKILIANRGEIAVRILRACRDLGIPAVVAYSEADRDTLAVRMADEAICIGPAEARKSYLNQPAVVSAAVITGCDAVHPGYGFLSEDAGFAEVCAAHDLPSSGRGRRCSSDSAASTRCAACWPPTGCRPCRAAAASSPTWATRMDQAQEAGYPVLLKPSAGGGGRGMRLVRSPREMETSLPLARSEAQAAFGDDSIYFEKWIEESRHVEVQVLVDQHGNGIHLGERDCSIQRRHQKIIEEAPSPAMDDAARERLRDLAIRAVVAAGYESAGTLEFLLDREGNFYFIEINCRIQVEHPVTEMLTGLDLIAEQIRLAAGERLALTQEQVRLRGHAIEFRINAEDPGDNFSPQTGVVDELLLPGGPGVRVDTHLYAGYEVPPFYDSLLAKLIVWGETRPMALARARRALAEFKVGGMKTNLPFHRGIIDNAAFLEARGQHQPARSGRAGAFVAGSA